MTDTSDINTFVCTKPDCTVCALSDVTTIDLTTTSAVEEYLEIFSCERMIEFAHLKFKIKDYAAFVQRGKILWIIQKILEENLPGEFELPGNKYIHAPCYDEYGFYDEFSYVPCNFRFTHESLYALYVEMDNWQHGYIEFEEHHLFDYDAHYSRELSNEEAEFDADTYTADLIARLKAATT